MTKPGSGFLAIVDRAQSWAYVPIPKCASTSILLALRSHFGLPRVENPHGKGWPATGDRAWLAEHPQYFRWAVWRDPYSRLLSTWADKCRPMSPGLAASRAPIYSGLEGATFAEFVRHLLDLGFDPDARTAEKHLRSQSWYLMHNGRLLVDKLIPLPELPAHWQILQQRFGLPDLEHRNRQSRRQEVRQLYASDYHVLATIHQPLTTNH